jgi:hypothetical protein
MMVASCDTGVSYMAAGRNKWTSVSEKQWKEQRAKKV